MGLLWPFCTNQQMINIFLNEFVHCDDILAFYDIICISFAVARCFHRCFDGFSLKMCFCFIPFNVFFCIIIFLLYEISLEICFSLSADVDCVRHRILFKNQVIKWSCHLFSKLEILRININRTNTCRFQSRRTKNRNKNSFNDRSKVEVSQTRLVRILEASDDVSFISCFSSAFFSFVYDRSLLNSWLLIPFKSKTNVSGINTKVGIDITCKILYIMIKLNYDKRNNAFLVRSQRDHMIFLGHSVSHVIFFQSKLSLFSFIPHVTCFKHG